MVRTLVVSFFVVLFVLSCSRPPVYVTGERGGSGSVTRVVFCNLDHEYEYLVFVPSTSAFGSGLWVYVPTQGAGAASAEQSGIARAMSQMGYNNAPVTQVASSAFSCNTGLVSFSYLLFRRGRLISDRQRSFTLFVSPAPAGEARIINLVGNRL